MEHITNWLISGNMVWITFFISAGLIVFSAMQLAKYGDVLAARTGMGGMFVGVLLLAGATSLPELLTCINAVAVNEPNLAAGNLFGSSSFNMFILAILDVLSRERRVLRDAYFKHVLSGSLAVFICTLVLFFLVANPVINQITFQIGWIGIDSILIGAVYIFSIYLIQKNEPDDVSTEMTPEELSAIPSLRTGIIGFSIAAGVLILISPLMVNSSARIAEITGLGTSFIGSTLVAFITSLPELVTTISALKIGAPEMAMGNLFGSNLFNMFGIAVTDIFYTQGRLIGEIDSSFLIVGILGVLMTCFALIGNIVKFKRVKIMEFDSVIMVILYFFGMVLLYRMT